jgi:hypothetical protein
LRDLEVKVATCPNPTVTLLEEIGASHAGYGPLVRFIDLSKVRDGGSVPGIKDPLRTKENRWAHSKEPGKHKTVEDQYTRSDPTLALQDHISEQVAELTIGDMRRVIGQAVTDQELRHNFMEQRLQDALQVRHSPRYVPRWVHVAEQTLQTERLDAVA